MWHEFRALLADNGRKVRPRACCGVAVADIHTAALGGKTSATTIIFNTNKAQAVRLPKDVAFPEGMREVEITKLGNSRVISPVGCRWDAFFADPHKLSDDFLPDREQGASEEREPL
jgi:antitoxin VapB